MRSLGRYHARLGLEPLLSDLQYLSAYNLEVGPQLFPFGQPSMNLRDREAMANRAHRIVQLSERKAQTFRQQTPRELHPRPERHVCGRHWDYGI